MSHSQGTEVISETYSVSQLCIVNMHKYLFWGLAQKAHLSPTNKSEACQNTGPREDKLKMCINNIFLIARIFSVLVHDMLESLIKHI